MVLAAVSLAPVACCSQETQPTAVPATLDASGQPVRLVSAFFGLDNGLAFRINLLCLGGSGKDGMPVVLSHAVDEDTLQPEAFRVLTRSGAERTMGRRRSVEIVAGVGLEEAAKRCRRAARHHSGEDRDSSPPLSDSAPSFQSEEPATSS